MDPPPKKTPGGDIAQFALGFRTGSLDAGPLCPAYPSQVSPYALLLAARDTQVLPRPGSGAAG